MLKQQSGFTLVELLLAMAIFSFGLLIIVTGFIALLGFYQNGVQSRIVQTTARSALDEIVTQGRQAQWFAYNAPTNDPNYPGSEAANTYYDVCMSNGNIFYLDQSTHKLMRGQWNSSSSLCLQSAATNVQAVTSPDAQVSALIPEPIDNYTINGPGGLPTPCTTADANGACGPFNGVSSVHKSMRVTIRVASNVNLLTVPASTATSCATSSPAYCAIATLSTTLTAGEF